MAYSISRVSACRAVVKLRRAASLLVYFERTVFLDMVMDALVVQEYG